MVRIFVHFVYLLIIESIMLLHRDVILFLVTMTMVSIL